MRIRKFKPEDATKLSKLMRETIVTSLSSDYSKKAIKVLSGGYDAEGLIKHSEKTAIFVAFQDGKLLGTISLEGNRIRNMFVLPKLQGKRIGSKLLKYIEKFAKKRREKTLKVRSSLTAFGFYKRLGYCKTRRGSIKLIGPIIWMEKKL